jgi:hypothetical protein
LPVPPKGRGSILFIADAIGAAEGPGGFHLRSLRKALTSTHVAYIMTGQPSPKAHKTAADLAEAGLCVVVIETQPSEERPWLDFVSRHAPDAVTEVVSPTALDLLLMRKGG